MWHAHLPRFYADMCGHFVDWNAYLSTWFRGARIEDIHLGNLLEMLVRVQDLLEGK